MSANETPPGPESHGPKAKVVDLSHYKQASRVRAERAAAAQRKAARGAARSASGHQPILGGRPRAGLILALLAAFFLAMTFGPRLLG